MLIIKVLGPGCNNCQVLAQKAKEALADIATERGEEIDGTVIKVTERQDIMQYPILHTPGLVVNEKLVSAGRIPDVNEIKNWLVEAATAA